MTVRVSSTSIPGAAVAGAQFTEGDQLQVQFILQLSGLLSQICNTGAHTQRQNIVTRNNGSFYFIAKKTDNVIITSTLIILYHSGMLSELATHYIDRGKE